MFKLNKNLDVNNYLNRVKCSSKRLIIFDYDGTLAPFVKDREHAPMYPQLVSVVNELIYNSKNIVVFLSGRDVNSLRSQLLLSGIQKIPELWGGHGSHYIKDKETNSVHIDEKALNELNYIKKKISLSVSEKNIEIKNASIAVHFRDVEKNDLNRTKAFLSKIWKEREYNNIDKKDFNGGVEFIVSTINKGNAISLIMKDRIDVPAVFFGDDLTDEHGFKVLKGKGLNVLVKDHIRKTYADIIINTPEELRMFLKNWTER